MWIEKKYLPNYSYKDYCLWEGQWELIEGIPYAMSPLSTLTHQRVNGTLFEAFNKTLKKGCRECTVYIPIDWKITEHTIVQPDLSVDCKPTKKNI